MPKKRAIIYLIDKFTLTSDWTDNRSQGDSSNRKLRSSDHLEFSAVHPPLRQTGLLNNPRKFPHLRPLVSLGGLGVFWGKEVVVRSNYQKRVLLAGYVTISC